MLELLEQAGGCKHGRLDIGLGLGFRVQGLGFRVSGI